MGCWRILRQQKSLCELDRQMPGSRIYTGRPWIHNFQVGFSLSFSAVAPLLAAEDQPNFFAYLRDSQVQFDDRIATSHFGEDFYDWSEDELFGVHVTHPEAGWSWWSKLQDYLARNLGAEACPTVRAIHAWYGVALPADIDPFVLGTPMVRTPREFPQAENPSIEQRLDQMLMDLGGRFTNLYVVSGPRLLKELQAGLEHSGLVGVDALQLYHAVDDDDEESVARCYLAMTHKFLKKGLEHGYLVWWVK